MKSKLLKLYGEFHTKWDEIIEEEDRKIALFWHNKKTNKSTWENPLFILTCLLENSVNPAWVPIDWDSIDDDIIKIKFLNKKVLYISKLTKKISDTQPKLNSTRLNLYEMITENDANINTNSNSNNTESTQALTKEVIKETIKENVFNSLNESGNTNDQPSFTPTPFQNEIDNFKNLLKEKNIPKLTTYEKELPKLVYDERFKALPKDLRKEVFDQFLNTIPLYDNNTISSNSDSRKKGIEYIKKLIKSAIENGEINLNTSYSDFQTKYEEDEKLQSAFPSDREFLFNEAKLKLKKLIETKKKASYDHFNAMLRKAIKFEDIKEDTTYKQIKKIIKSYPEYSVVSSSSERNQLIEKFLTEMKKLHAISHHKLTDDENQNLIILQNELAEKEFNAMLKEKVKYETTWEEAEKKLESDSRWRNENLTYEKKMNIYKNYMFGLRETSRREYLKLLEEKIGLNQEITWHDAQHMLQREPRYRDLQDRDREQIFTDYANQIHEKIVAEFTKFLESEELQNIVTKDSPIEGPLFEKLINQINYDIRSQRMMKHPEKRDKIVRMRIKSLKFKYEKQMREERKIQNRNRPPAQKRNFDMEWEKGNVIK